MAILMFLLALAQSARIHAMKIFYADARRRPMTCLGDGGRQLGGNVMMNSRDTLRKGRRSLRPADSVFARFTTMLGADRLRFPSNLLQIAGVR
jgi:hypothetical protein